MGWASILIGMIIQGWSATLNNIRIIKLRIQGKTNKEMEDEFEITARFLRQLFLKSFLYLILALICAFAARYVITIFIQAVTK